MRLRATVVSMAAAHRMATTAFLGVVAPSMEEAARLTTIAQQLPVEVKLPAGVLHPGERAARTTMAYAGFSPFLSSVPAR